tara:strand:+ start:14590 stop:14937 length:348 start_codon:yes stop_codon:yes gene_type:complete
MLDITLIWFPLLKFAFTAFLLYMGYYFFKKKNNLVGTWYLITIVLFWVFMPIKYDGTNSVERNVVAQEMRTQEYKEVREDKVIIKTSVPTFVERMRTENARSLEANKAVTNEIVK